MKENIKVSVIMPSLNVVEYIEECLESVITQTMDNIEIICVDACSTDGTFETLKKYALKDNRICLLKSDIRSYGYQVNLGIKKATGKYVAIVETDDFIHENMIKCLFGEAEKYGADYVKGNFCRFYSLNNGTRVKQNMRLSSDRYKLYEKEINPHECDYLYIYDSGIWKGIYNRKFLIENYIYFNETPGAAYQDIGFKERLLFASEKACYVPDIVYYYRTDREEASQYSPEALKNVWTEFLTMEAWERLKADKFYEKGHYLYMATAFVTESRNLLTRLNYDASRKEFSDYYSLFAYRVSNAINDGVIKIEEIGEGLSEELRILLESEDKYVDYLRAEGPFFDRAILRAKEEKNGVVIFGAGYFGEELIKFLDRHCLLSAVVAFVDNNIEIQNSKKLGFSILSLRESLKKFPDSLFIITTKDHYADMEKQFLSMGGNEDKVMTIW